MHYDSRSWDMHQSCAIANTCSLEFSRFSQRDVVEFTFSLEISRKSISLFEINFDEIFDFILVTLISYFTKITLKIIDFYMFSSAFPKKQIVRRPKINVIFCVFSALNRFCISYLLLFFRYQKISYFNFIFAPQWHMHPLCNVENLFDSTPTGRLTHQACSHRRSV